MGAIELEKDVPATLRSKQEDGKVGRVGGIKRGRGFTGIEMGNGELPKGWGMKGEWTQWGLGKVAGLRASYVLKIQSQSDKT